MYIHKTTFIDIFNEGLENIKGDIRDDNLLFQKKKKSASTDH